MKESVMLLEGTDIVKESNYLICDTTHSSTSGHVEMGYNLYHMTKDWLK